jgi:hypothetical protein
MISSPVHPPVPPGYGEPPERDRVDRVFTEIVARLIAEEPGWVAPAAQPHRVRTTARQVVAVAAARRGQEGPVRSRIAPGPPRQARLGERTTLARERSPPSCPASSRSPRAVPPLTSGAGRAREGAHHWQI